MEYIELEIESGNPAQVGQLVGRRFVPYENWRLQQLPITQPEIRMNAMPLLRR